MTSPLLFSSLFSPPMSSLSQSPSNYRIITRTSFLCTYHWITQTHEDQTNSNIGVLFHVSLFCTHCLGVRILSCRSSGSILCRILFVIVQVLVIDPTECDRMNEHTFPHHLPTTNSPQHLIACISLNFLLSLCFIVVILVPFSILLSVWREGPM